MPRKLLTQFYRQEILTLVRRGPMSRADLHDKTGVRLPTVIECLACLEKAGLVQEIKEAGSIRRGRKSFLVGLRPAFRSAIGIDLMGSCAQGARIAFDGSVLAEEALTFGTQPEEALSDLVSTLGRSSPVKMEGVAVSFPGLLHPGSLEIDATTAAAGFTSFAPLAALCRKRAWPLVFHNPPAALAEQEARRHPGVSIALVELDDGIGVSLASCQDSLSIPRVLNGEIGHLPVAGNNRACGCGALGCVETLLSTQRIVEDAREWLGGHRECLLFYLAKKDLANVDFNLLVQAVDAGDELLCGFLGERLSHLVPLLRQIILLYRPDRILLTGKLTRFSGLITRSVTSLRACGGSALFPELRSIPVEVKDWDPLSRARAGAMALFEKYFA